MVLDAGQNILTRQLPKTGQTTQYYASDDGNYEAGWWRGRLNANNRTRFIQQTIGGDDIVLDRATGLMWPEDFTGTGGNGGLVLSWSGIFGAVNFGSTLNFAGFGDWRLPNALELLSIVNFETGPPYIWPPFINCVWQPAGFVSYWTSTTYAPAVVQAMIADFSSPGLGARAKALSSQVIAVRKGI